MDSDPSRPDVLSDLEAVQPALLRQCRALVRDPVEAEDLVQDVLVAALTSDGFDPSRPLLPWLRGIARHKAIDRHRGRSAEAPLEHEPADAPPRPADAVGAARAGARAWMRWMSALRPRARAVLLLRDLLELDTAETAELLALTPSNVKVTLHRARRQLHEHGGHPTSSARTRAAAHVGSSAGALSGWGLRAVLPAADASQAAPLETAAAWMLWRSLLTGMLEQPSLPAEHEVRLRLTRAVAVHPMAYDPWPDLDAALALADALDDVSLQVDVRLARARWCSDRGRLNEAMAELDATPSEVPVHLRARLRMHRGAILWRQGHFEEASAAYLRALKTTEDPVERTACRQNLGLLDSYLGELERAVERCEAAVAEHHARGNVQYTARALNNLGMALHNLGRLDDARARFEESLARLAAAGLPPRHTTVNNLGLLDHEEGSWTQALSRFGHNLDHAGDNVRTKGIALANRGVVLGALGRHLEAARSLRDARQAALDEGATHLAAFVAAHLALARARCGDSAALDAAGEARSLLASTPDPTMAALIDVLEAAAAVTLGTPTSAGAAMLRTHAEPPPRSAALRIALQALRQVLAAA